VKRIFCKLHFDRERDFEVIRMKRVKKTSGDQLSRKKVNFFMKISITRYIIAMSIIATISGAAIGDTGATTAQQPAPSQTPTAGQKIQPDNPLGLTAAQDSKMKIRRKKYQNDLAALKANKKLSAAQKSLRSAALEKQAEADIKAILTPQQQSLAERLQKEELREIKNSDQTKKLLDRKKADEEKYKVVLKKLIASTTPDQKIKLKAILEGTKEKLNKIAADSTLSADQKNQKFAKVREESESEQKAIFTSEQISLMKEMDDIYTDRQNAIFELDKLNPIVIPAETPSQNAPSH
jgi:hypothetical protein